MDTERRYLALAVSTTAERTDVLQQVNRPMLAPCTIFDKAHDKAITFLSLNYNSRDLRLAELHECFDPSLSANEIIACGVCIALSWADRDRTFEPDVGDTLHDFLKVTAVSGARI